MISINPFSKNTPRLDWQRLKSKDKNVPDLYRSPVTGGWLVSAGIDAGLVFIPDEKHAWDGNSITTPNNQQKD